MPTYKGPRHTSVMRPLLQVQTYHPEVAPGLTLGVLHYADDA